MFQNLNIKHKILLYPVLFTLVILVVLFIFQQSNSGSKTQLNNIQKGYVPYLETANILSYELINLQREFQDAVAAADEEMLESTNIKYQHIKVMLDSAGNNIIGKNNDTLPILIKQFDNYYSLASKTSLAMIQGEFTEELSTNINTMIQEFNAIKEVLNALIIESKQESDFAFSTTIKTFNQSSLKIIIILLVSLAIFLLISFLISAPLNKSINVIRKRLLALAEGNLQTEEDSDHKLNKDEMGEMANSVLAVQEGLEKTSSFAEEIGKGNLNASFVPLSEQDKLGNALLSMKDNLAKSKAEEEKMKAEEEKNKWTATGLAKFGDIIRVNDEGVESLAFNVVKNLVDFLEINMGAIYVAEEENNETIYRIKSAIAYDRQKLIDSEFKIGEGLVGRCAFEKLTVYLTDIPQNYMKITSGLGDANPGYLLIVPLISDEKVFGVLELASFEEFEPYKISFVEKLAESIGSTLLSVQNNQQTVKLLEQSKLQSEELAAQEEEMRQNMEELQATQEEATRREEEMIAVINAFDNSVFKVEYNTDGIITAANEKYLNFLKATSNSLLDKNYKEEYNLMNSTNEDNLSLWPELMSGKSKTIKLDAKIDNVNYTIEEHYTPIIYKDETRPSKILKVSFLTN